MRSVFALALVGLASACGSAPPTKSNNNSVVGATCTAAQIGNGRCSGSVMQTCDGTAWISGADCGTAGCTISGTAATCNSAAPCGQSGLQRCNSGFIQTCNGTAWVDGINCGAAGCTANGNTVSCNSTGCGQNGNQRCNINTIQTCNGTSWVDGTNCGAAGCSVSGNTASCNSATCSQNGNQRCNVNTIQTCNGTSWVDGTNCGTAGCTATGTTAACNSATTCDPEAEYLECTGGVLRFCELTGTWSTVATCSGAAPTCRSVDDMAWCGESSNPCTQSANPYWVCDGNAAVMCNATAAAGLSLDCSDFFYDGTVSGTCYDFGGNWGGDCLVATGTQCLYLAGSDVFQQPCGSSTPSATGGCDVSTGLCSNSAAACTPTSGTYNPTCSGNKLFISCAGHGQPMFLDCNTALSTTCASGDCRSKAVGSKCYTMTELGYFTTLCGTVAGTPASSTACDLASENCVAGQATCVVPAAGQKYVPNCSGNYLVVNCDDRGPQRVVLNCADVSTGSGTCQSGTPARCVHSTQGKWCTNPAGTGPVVVACGGGLTCKIDTVSGEYQCLP
jgi:hypothetical protein